MRKLITIVCALTGLVVCAAVPVSADDLATAVKERRYLMEDVVKPAYKRGDDMVRGKVPFDGAKGAKAMNDIQGVPDKYVKLFPKGTEQAGVPQALCSGVYPT